MIKTLDIPFHKPSRSSHPLYAALVPCGGVFCAQGIVSGNWSLKCETPTFRYSWSIILVRARSTAHLCSASDPVGWELTICIAGGTFFACGRPFAIVGGLCLLFWWTRLLLSPRDHQCDRGSTSSQEWACLILDNPCTFGGIRSWGRGVTFRSY